MNDSVGRSVQTSNDRRFQPTRWSLILAAQQQSSDALNTFCLGYWYPVYAHVRRRGLLREDAQDCTQQVFARLSQPHALDGVRADRGRFRTFLLACADHEVSHWRAVRTARKRGGEAIQLPLDEPEAQRLLAFEVFPAPDPAAAFDRDFATALVRQVLATLRREYQRIGHLDLFAALEPLLAAPPEHGGLVALADRLGITEGNLRIRWHRFRRRFAELLLEEVAQLVADPEDARIELRQLLTAWATASPAPSQAKGGNQE